MLGGLMLSPSIDLGNPAKTRARSTTSSRLPSSSSFGAPPSASETTTNPVTRTAVSSEYAALRYQDHCPLGMYVMPSNENILVWDAVLFVHQGYYTDAILKFRLTFPTDYPERPPTAHFLTDIFHPLVSQQDGRFNLSSRFRPWRPKEHHVFDVLHWIKASFKKHALDKLQEHDCLNKEALRLVAKLPRLNVANTNSPALSRLYHESTSSFAALATQSSSLSQSPTALYDRDHPSVAGKGNFSLMFREVEPDKLNALRSQLCLSDWKDPI